MANESGRQGPPQLPPLVKGQTVQNGPYTVTVTDSMVKQRERENRELARRWEQEQRRRERMLETQESYAGEFKEFNIRRRFLRRVFSILTLQLMFTTLVIATFCFVEEAKNFMLSQPLILLMALVTFMFTFFAITCSDCARRDPPCNVVCLFFLTLSLSYMTAAASVFYTAESVLLTAITTTFVTMIIFFVAACTKFDLTKYTGFLLITSLVLTIGMFIMLFVMLYTQIAVLQVWIAIIGTFLISMYLFFDVQTIMGGKSIELNPDEVVYATTQLYVDIVLLYRYLLMLMGNMGE